MDLIANIPWSTLIAVPISIVALIVALKNYRRKSGLAMRGTFTPTMSVWSDDTYISQVILENLKDRAVTIFTIYLRLGWSYYIELENFEEKPLLLKAYESYRGEYGPVQFYGVNLRRIHLNDLFRDDRVRKRIVLSTGDGKYVVPPDKKRWIPYLTFFANHLTAIIRPVILQHKDQHVGSNVRYILELQSAGNDEVVLIRKDEHIFRRFRHFAIPREVLETKEALEQFLADKKKEGLLAYDALRILETASWQEERAHEYRGEPIKAEHVGWFQYHLLGRLLTWRESRDLRKENAKRALARRPPDHQQ